MLQLMTLLIMQLSQFLTIINIGYQYILEFIYSCLIFKAFLKNVYKKEMMFMLISDKNIIMKIFKTSSE